MTPAERLENELRERGCDEEVIWDAIVHLLEAEDDLLWNGGASGEGRAPTY